MHAVAIRYLCSLHLECFQLRMHFHAMVVAMQDLESDSPLLKDSAGQVVCQGRYAEEIGTVMVLQDANSVHAADATEQQAAGSSGQAAAGSAPQLKYQCHTEQRLRMWAPEQAPEATQRGMSPSEVTPTAITPTGVGG